MNFLVKSLILYSLREIAATFSIKAIINDLWDVKEH